MDSLDDKYVQFAIKQVTDEALAWPDRARAVTVETAAQYAAVADMLLGIKAMRKKIESAFGPVVKDAHRAWVSAQKFRKQSEDPLVEAERVLKDAMTTYRQAQRDRDEVEQKRLEAEAKKVSKAQGLETPPVLVVSTVPAVSGIRASSRWSVTVTDEAALITAAARNKALRPLLKVDLTALRRHVQAMKGQVKIPGVTVTETETLSVVTS